ncbi:hypothetical protein [Streptomyces sp. CB03238]|uniref:hypothetical protein n=1 Tax=Streptomyces sp. CB03238 TaxID=1907777 RepID=UPI0015C4DCC2|nr:hypothetical protein [Streptomyces sp. CB03238]
MHGTLHYSGRYAAATTGGLVVYESRLELALQLPTARPPACLAAVDTQLAVSHGGPDFGVRVPPTFTPWLTSIRSSCVGGCGMGGGADEATPKPEVVRNQISDGTVIFGPVVQAGTFTGQIHHHYTDDRRPLDLPSLRLWVDRIAADYRTMVEDSGDRAGVAHVRQIDLVRAGLDDSGLENERRKDAVRRLVVAGIIGYLARPGTPDEPVPEQILLDLIVFSLWPVVTAKKLPPGWQGELAQITSPRLAALVDRARAERKPTAETFARATANKSFSSAMVTLFDDLADPRRGGALLTAMAVAGGLPAPPTGPREGKKVAAWALAIAGGAALAEALRDRDSRAARLIGEVVINLPVDSSDSFHPIDPLELVGWLLG